MPQIGLSSSTRLLFSGLSVFLRILQQRLTRLLSRVLQLYMLLRLRYVWRRGSMRI
ncbi:hypothetical protein BDR03DRAFT_955177 [Suillus americanus]|nr:hypothetical protein BDR03DRAFT_955177 [Suillus americanus]